MGQWILLQSEAELEVKAKALRRKCRGHYYTNYYFIHSTRDEDLRYTEMFYQEDGDNIYAIERMDDFYKFFYFVGDVEHIRLELLPSVECGVLTCAINEEEGKEKQGPVLDKLYLEGFSDYKTYHFYDRKAGQAFRRFPNLKGYDLTYQASVGELSVLYDIFDPYSDDLPLRKAFPEYLKTMDILSCAVDGKYAGSSIFPLNGWGNAYIFAHDEFPGIGAYLAAARSEWFDREHPNKLSHAAIEDHNTRAIRLNEAVGAKRTNQYHKILIRRK